MSEEQQLSKKDRRDQRRTAEQDAKIAAERQAKGKKFIFVGIVIIGVLLAAWLLRGALSGSGSVPEQGAAADPIHGSSQPLVTIREYADFQCPACQKMGPILNEVITEFGDDVAVEFNDFPLPANIHPYAFMASEAGQCAYAQDKFWEYHDKLYEEQAVWSILESDSAVQDYFEGYAGELGLNTITFSNCMSKHETKTGIQEDVTEGDKAEVKSTPTLFINTERYTGVSTYSSLKKVIEKQLEVARKEADTTNLEVVE